MLVYDVCLGNIVFDFVASFHGMAASAYVDMRIVPGWGEDADAGGEITVITVADADGKIGRNVVVEDGIGPCCVQKSWPSRSSMFRSVLDLASWLLGVLLCP